MYDPHCSHCRLSLVVSVIHAKSRDDTRACIHTAMQQSVLRLWLLMCGPFISIMPPAATVPRKGLHIARDRHHIWVQLSNHGILYHLSVPFKLFMFHLCAMKSVRRSLSLSLSWEISYVPTFGFQGFRLWVKHCFKHDRQYELI